MGDVIDLAPRRTMRVLESLKGQAIMRGVHTVVDVDSNVTLHTVWCICQTREGASTIALAEVAGKLPRLYEFECDCLSAWRGYPSFGVGAYVPWRLIVSEAPTGLKIVSSSRIGAW